MGAYLERCRASADKFVKRLSTLPEVVGAECVVAFLYAADDVFARTKPRLDAEASDGASVKLKRESSLAFGAGPGTGTNWLERISNAMPMSLADLALRQSKQRISHTRCGEIDDALIKLAKIEDLSTGTPAVASPELLQPQDAASAEEMLMVVEAEMERQLREQATASESSQAQKVLDDAAARGLEQEERCELAARRSAALGVAFEKRAEALAKAGAAVKALSRADADAKAASVLRALGDRLLDEDKSVDEGGRSLFRGAMVDAIDDARLSARACGLALRQRAAVAAAVGDANGRSARARTKHARCEAALAAARERRREAAEQSRRDLESARRVSDAFADAPPPRARPVVDAAMPASRHSYGATIRAIKLSNDAPPRRQSYDAESPLALALDRTQPSVGDRARDVVQAACAPVRRLPETLNCRPPVARTAETLTCGVVAAPKAGGPVADVEAALALAERQAAEARTEATMANDAQAAAETDLLDATRRVARELTVAHSLRALELAHSLKSIAHRVLDSASRERQAWLALSHALDPPKQRRQSHFDTRQTFDTPPNKVPQSTFAAAARSSSDSTSWYDLVDSQPVIK